MGNRKRFIAGIILAAVYAFFFASANFFYHSHIISDVKIVHSHPWSGAAHSHNADQISLIGTLDTAIYEEAEAIIVPGILPDAVCSAVAESPESAPHQTAVFSFSLRAPPVQC